MKVLIVSNECDRPNRVGNPIIGRLINALSTNTDITKVSFCPFMNKLKDFYTIRENAKSFDLIHVQFGGFYALLIWMCLIGLKMPKVLTFHGTDIHAKEILTTKSFVTKAKIWLNQKSSFCSIFLFDKIGLVSSSLLAYIPKFVKNCNKHKLFLQPLGVDYTKFVPMRKADACKLLGIPNDKYILFSDKSGTVLKRRDIAEKIVVKLANGFKLLVMCGVKPDEVPIYINACDFILLTSDEEGSPNITREALSLNKRVFSVDVGDVKQQLYGLTNSSIISRNPEEAAKQINDMLAIDYIDNSRDKLRTQIDFARIAKHLVELYMSLSIKKNV